MICTRVSCPMICKGWLVSWSKPCFPQTQIGLDSLCACKEHFSTHAAAACLKPAWGAGWFSQVEFHVTVLQVWWQWHRGSSGHPWEGVSKCPWNSNLFLFARLDPLQWFGRNHKKLFSLSQNSPFSYKPIENTIIPLETLLLHWKHYNSIGNTIIALKTPLFLQVGAGG